MNKLSRTAVGISAFAATMSMGGNIVHAEQGDGNADILAEMPDYLRDQAVEDGVITCTISDSIRSELGVTALQKEFSERGYSRSGIDGIDGKKFCMDTLQLQDDNGLYVDGEVGNEVVWFLGGMDDLLKEHGKNLDKTKKASEVSKEKSKKEKDYTIADCNRYDEWSKDTIKSVQRALGATVDGLFGDESCSLTIEHQLEQGVVSPNSTYLGYLGAKTLSSLGVEPIKANKAKVDKSGFDPKSDCPSRDSCELLYDLSEKQGYVKVNDGVYKTAVGETLFQFPIIPGGNSNPTNTGHFRLGHVENSKDGNPWRLSTITAAINPFSAPNLYKFRRHNPVDGSWSGEGTHGTRTFWGASSGCARTEPKTQDIIAEIPVNTRLLIQE